MIAHIALALIFAIFILILVFCSCTVEVKPIAKPKPVVIYKHRSTHHKAKPHATPHPHLLQPEGTTKLIPMDAEPTP